MLRAQRTGPRGGRPLRVALLCSRRAPGLTHLLHEDPNRGSLYVLAGVLTSEPDCQERAELEAERVPLLVHDLREFYRERGARLGDRAVRREYDAATAAMLRRYRPDLVVLSGYLYVLTEPMLEAFPSRIVNVHDSDLAVADRDGRPRYRGLHSTRDAIVAGEGETRSTVHLVTEEVDVGPILVRSWPFDVHPLVDDARRWQATDILKAYAYAHREWMMRAAWGPLLVKTIQLFARGEVSVEFGGVRVAGDPVPWVWRRCPSESPLPVSRASGETGWPASRPVRYRS